MPAPGKLEEARNFREIINWYEENIAGAKPEDYAFQIVYTETRSGGGEPEIEINAIDNIGGWDGPDYPVDD